MNDNQQWESKFRMDTKPKANPTIEAKLKLKLVKIATKDTRNCGTNTKTIYLKATKQQIKI
jgi:hypothetical protein